MSTEPTVHRSYSFHRQLCDSLGVALVATDAELIIRVWNGAAARLFGAAADRMIGTPVASIMPMERRSLVERVLQRVIRTGEVVDFEFQQRDAHGERSELVVTIAPVTSEPSVRVGASLCIRDITRRIALQNELNETRKLSALGALSGALAHHFNNILGGIITGIDYARETQDPTITNRVLDQTSRSLMRASALVNGLLAFSEGGRCSDDLADLNEVVFEIADDFEKQAHANGVAFTLNMPKLPVLPVPRVQVTTILRNILQNGLEAMPNGGKLTLDVEQDEDRINLSVTDTGCGLDEAGRSRLFEPFWSTKQGMASGTTQVKGLGLAIAYGLVQVLGGSITVSSQPGVGSCFKVSLPRPHGV